MISYSEPKRGDGESQHFWDFRILKRREEKYLLFTLLSHSYSIAWGPKSPREEGDLFF